jgi:hypothetical protein
MPIPAALVPILADVGVRAGGALISKLVGGKRKELDLVTPAINESQAQLTDMATDSRRQQALLESDLARVGSTGFSGGAARQDLLDANARGGAMMRGSILDTLANARQQQELINTEAKNAERAATIEGITAAAGAVGSGLGGMLGQKQLIKDITQMSEAAQPSVAATATPMVQQPATITPTISTVARTGATLDDLKGAYNTQRFYPGYSQLFDYRTMNKRMFDSIQN